MAEKTYPSDLSDAQWRAIEPFVERPDPRGNPGKYEKRSVVNAILYVAREGCRWRSLPVNFPPWEAVYDHFRRWRERGVWEELAQVLARADRRKVRSGDRAFCSDHRESKCEKRRLWRGARLPRRQENKRPLASCGH